MLEISIISPDQKIFAGQGKGIQLPGTEGSFEILPGHAPLISTLDKGNVVVREESGDKTFNVEGGVVEVLNDQVIVLIERLVKAAAEVQPA